MQWQGGRAWPLAACGLVIGMAVPAVALAHQERPSYWPDPAADTSVTPAAGGKVPTARSLESAVTGAGPGEVRVVCQGKHGRESLRLAMASIADARSEGFRLRPSQPVTKLSTLERRRLLEINGRLAKQCEYDSIQAAVDDSGNNDRVVIMPGHYTEPASRAQPENDPRCAPSLLQEDASGSPTPSYEYQSTCPNDQNLVAVMGRAVKGDPLPEPRSDRQGIPEQELGECIRCNMQIEGSGPKPEDVIIDAGTNYVGTGPEARPSGHAKDVVLRVDRADGFVGRNFLVRGAQEHGFYTEETDGVFLDKTKFFWNADYGHLSFTVDHQIVQNCDGMGAGDAALYPGAAPETGSQATAFYPDAPRANTIIRRCDMRISGLGYSGSMGNAVRITDNHIYGNTTGIATDTLSSAGHPGFPADSPEVDHNYIYSNNFDIYADDSPVDPLVPVPIGTGIIYAGVNDARVHDNWFFDNWRNGTMLLAVPDSQTSAGGAEGDIYPGVSCPGAPENGISTSCGNHQFRNRMGQVPAGFEFPEPLERYGIPHGAEGRETLRNGVDFWWDEFLSNTGNCWYGNVGPDGTAASVTGSGDAGGLPGLPPNLLPDCGAGENAELSIGNGDVAKEAYLVACSQGRNSDIGPMFCDWWTPPGQPGSAQAAAQRRKLAAAALRYSATPEAAELRQRMEALTAGSVK